MAPTLGAFALLAATLSAPCGGVEAVAAADRGANSARRFSLKGARRQVERRHGASGTTKSKEVQPTCSCDCCEAVSRRPGEVVAGVSIKCAPSEGKNPDMCTEECTPSSDDTILASTMQDEAVDYLRFCFHECRPAQGSKSPPETQCVALDVSQAKRVVDTDGNPMDPASVYDPQTPSQDVPVMVVQGVDANQVDAAELERLQREARPVAPFQPVMPMMSLMAGNQAVNVRQQPDMVDPDEARRVGDTGRAQAAAEGEDARQVAALRRAQEAEEAHFLHRQLAWNDPEAQVIPSQVGTMDVGSQLKDVRRAASIAKVAAEGAAVSAGRAVSAFKAAKAASWSKAITTAEEKVRKVQDAVSEKWAKWRAPPPPSWRSKAKDLTLKTAAPYMSDIANAQHTAQQYADIAAATAAKAEEQRLMAEKLNEEVASLKENGRIMQAAQKQQQADQANSDAAGLASKSTKARELSAQADATVPQYYAAAKAAVAAAIPTMDLS